MTLQIAGQDSEQRAVRLSTQRTTAGAAPTIGIGVIGYGYWGPNLVRNFAELSGARVVAVSDLRTQRLSEIHRRYPAISTTTDYRDLICDPDIQALVIATPVSSHFALTMEALQAGKHVFVEKPLAASVGEGEQMVEAAKRYDRVLMVDHTFVYTGAVRKIKELIDDGRLGSLYYYDSVRVNLGLVRHDINVLWDLAVHDLSIMDYVLARQPYAVAATGASHIPDRPVNTAYLTCFFSDNVLAHFHVNWLAPVKIRRTLIGGDRQMIVYDDLEPSEKIKVYDKGILLDDNLGSHDLRVGYRSGDMWAPQLSLTEALRIEAQHFVECIERDMEPDTDGEAGLRVVRVLEAATKSLMQGGRPIMLQEGARA